MKFDKNKAFPYPVLRPFSDDYKDVEFQATVEFKVDKEKILTSANFAISATEIVEEIEKGNAEYVAVISCRDTYFQSVISSKDKTIEKEFGIGELRGEVSVNTYVMAIKDITNFQCPDINEEFGPGPFKFVVGDILAQDEAQVFYFDRDMFRPITSVFNLVKKEGQPDGIWTISFDEDHLQIEVSSNTKEIIDEARNSTKNKAVLLNSIYFSTAMQAIQKLKDSKEDHEFKKWAQVIFKQAHNKGLDLDAHDAYLLTEKLMQEPLKRLNDYVFKGSE
jgi:hypothetical protein